MKDKTSEEINRVAEVQQRCRQCGGTGFIWPVVGGPSVPCPDCEPACQRCHGSGVVYFWNPLTCQLEKSACKICGPQPQRQFVADLQRLTDQADRLASCAEGVGTLACLCRLLARTADEIRQSYLRNLEERS